MENKKVDYLHEICGCDYDEDCVEVEFQELKKITDKAVLVEIDGEDVWLPQSQICDADSIAQTITMKEWIAKEKGIL